MIVAVACAARPARKRDVNEILDSGAGWSKSASGYSYDIPETKLDAVVEQEPEPEQPQFVEVVDVPADVPEIVEGNCHNWILFRCN